MDRTHQASKEDQHNQATDILAPQGDPVAVVELATPKNQHQKQNNCNTRTQTHTHALVMHLFCRMNITCTEACM
eukprot:COSAG01_NODE_4588_length_4893_cov_88.707551_4_plen_74_part_00